MFKRAGLFHITGEQDTGKTTFALTCGIPLNRILFLDHDIKTKSIVQDLGIHSFGAYHNLNSLRNKHQAELDFADAVLALIKAADPKDYDALIFDNFTPFEDLLYPYALKHKDKFVQTWASMGVIKVAQQWGVSFQITEILFDEWLEKFKAVFIITHLKDHNLNGVKTGKMIPAVKRVLPKKANMRVWLRHNEIGGGIPVGLILKRPGKFSLTPEGVLDVVNFLPRRMPKCTWAEIDKFYDNPFGEGETLTAKERAPFIPNAFELSILDDVLTPDQRHSYELTLEFGKQEEELLFDVEELSEEVKNKIKSMKDKPPAIIARECGVPIDLVKTVLS